MLYSAHSSVDRGSLVLGHFVPHFPPNSGGFALMYGNPLKYLYYSVFQFCCCYSYSHNRNISSVKISTF